MKCPRCAAACPPGSVACSYCGAPLASPDQLGEAARALDARFDALAAAVTAALEGLSPAGTSSAPGADPVARMRDALEAQARALPPPTTAQEVMVWLRRAPGMAWVSLRGRGIVRSVALGPLAETVAGLYRDRETWETRDPGLKALFAQHEALAREAAPTLTQGARRFARANPLVMLALGLMALFGVWSSLRASRRSARRSSPRRRRPRPQGTR